MSAIKVYSNDSLWIVMWDHRPPGRFAPHDKNCDILRTAIKSRISADMLSLHIRYSVIIHITYSLLHTCNFFQMLMQINRSNWGHLQKGALCPMLLNISNSRYSQASTDNFTLVDYHHVVFLGFIDLVASISSASQELYSMLHICLLYIMWDLLLPVA